MGQRFTLDEYVFGQLIWRNKGRHPEYQPRGLPKGLDFLAALGSQDAYATLNDMGENRIRELRQADGQDEARRSQPRV